MELARKIIPVIRKAMLEALVESARAAVKDACTQLIGQNNNNQADADKLAAGQEQLISRFSDNLARPFDALLEARQQRSNVIDYGSLSLVEESDLEAMIAMEGMVAHARNCDISEYLALTTRLNSLLWAPTSMNPTTPWIRNRSARHAVMPCGH